MESGWELNPGRHSKFTVSSMPSIFKPFEKKKLYLIKLLQTPPPENSLEHAPNSTPPIPKRPSRPPPKLSLHSVQHWVASVPECCVGGTN